jgi:hypothetical protein
VGERGREKVDALVVTPSEAEGGEEGRERGEGLVKPHTEADALKALWESVDFLVKK